MWNHTGRCPCVRPLMGEDRKGHNSPKWPSSQGKCVRVSLCYAIYRRTCISTFCDGWGRTTDRLAAVVRFFVVVAVPLALFFSLLFHFRWWGGGGVEQFSFSKPEPIMTLVVMLLIFSLFLIASSRFCKGIDGWMCVVARYWRYASPYPLRFLLWKKPTRDVYTFATQKQNHQLRYKNADDGGVWEGQWRKIWNNKHKNDTHQQFVRSVVRSVLLVD